MRLNVTFSEVKLTGKLNFGMPRPGKGIVRVEKCFVTRIFFSIFVGFFRSFGVSNIHSLDFFVGVALKDRFKKILAIPYMIGYGLFLWVIFKFEKAHFGIFFTKENSGFFNFKGL